MAILRSSKILISAFVIALVVSMPAFAAGKAKSSDHKSVFAAGVNYGLGDSGLGFVVDYSGDNAFNLPLVLRGFYHSANSSVNYLGANTNYTNSTFGIADLYEFQNVGNNLTPYIGLGFQFQNIAVGALTATGSTLFYTIGAKYAVNENISLDISYNNAGQASITSINGAAIPTFTTNAGGITLGALYAF